ncbi:hypothetical protein P9112_011954 [Eukaryota sp. TZLM1-RC]
MVEFEVIDVFNCLHLYDSALFVADLFLNEQSPSIDYSSFQTPTLEISPSFHVANTYYMVGNYNRVVHHLSHTDNDLELFLKCQSLLKLGESSPPESSDSLHLFQPSNTNASIVLSLLTNKATIEGDFDDLIEHLGTFPWFNLHLLGQSLLYLNKKQYALHCFLLSVTKCPLFYDAWKCFFQCVSDRKHLDLIKNLFKADGSISSIISAFFLCLFYISISHHSSAEPYLNHFCQFFHKCPLSLEIQGRFYYSCRNFPKSREFFEKIVDQFPSRTSGLEIYSNLLYVDNNAQEISNLSNKMSINFSNCWIANIIKGNYLSLKQSRKEASIYFLKAHYISPFSPIPLILLGHELLELRNLDGSLKAYLKASELAPLDFRSCYSLGQLYEVCGLHQLSVHHYSQALNLNCEEPRIWSALGLVYATLKNFDSSKRLFEKSLEISSDDDVIWLHYGSACCKSNDLDKASKVFHKVCTGFEFSDVVLPLLDDEFQSELVICSKYLKQKGEIKMAEEILLPVLELGSLTLPEVSSFLASLTVNNGEVSGRYSPTKRVKFNSSRGVRSPIQR